MARRNRKKGRRRQDGFIFPAPFAGIVVVVSSLALAYVWLGCRCESLGRELKALEQQQAELKKQYDTEAFKWARKKSPRNIERMLERCGITMVWPHRTRIVRLSEDDLNGGLSAGTSVDAGKYASLDRVVRQ